MEDSRVWEFEESLWTASPEHYQESIDDACLMVVPSEPHILTGAQAIEAVSRTPRWTKVAMSDQQVSRPQEGLIVVAYTVDASKDEGARYQARCSSTYRRIAHDEWRVVQHQQTPSLAG